MLLSSDSGDALLTMILSYLESGDCPQHEVLSLMTPLRGGINRLKLQLQTTRQLQATAVVGPATLAARLAPPLQPKSIVSALPGPGAA